MKRIYYLLIFYIFMACTPKPAENAFISDGSYLDKTGELVINLDHLSSYEFYNAILYGQDTSEEILFNLNYTNYSLDLYDTKDGKLLKRISINKGGPDGVDNLQGLSIVNMDSIFILERFKLNGSILIDTTGKVKSKLKADRVQTDVAGLVNHLSDISNKTTLYGDILYFSRYVLGEGPDEFMKFKGEGMFDLASGQVNFISEILPPSIYAQYPGLTHQGTFSSIKPSQSEWVMAWHHFDSLIHYIHTESGWVKQLYYSGVKDYIQYTPSPASAGNDFDNAKNKFESHSFGTIYHDVEEDQYHRVVYHPLPLDAKKHQGKNPFLLKDFSILTFNKSFEIIGRSHFKAGTYDPRVMIIGKKGLYLPRINPSYSQLAEDQLIYDIFSK